MPVTPYPDIEKLLGSLLYQMQRVLDDSLIGLYLYGSLVTGDFDPEISDIDLLAVTRFDIDNQQFVQLQTMHNDLIARNPSWDDRIEVQYLSTDALQTFKTRRSQIAVISPGEPFNIKDAGIDWLINWYIVREYGLVLFGPNFKTIIPPISMEEFLQVSREQAMDWVEWVGEPRDGKGQSYAILTMCRALYVSQNTEHVSKKQAALWTQEKHPQWTSLIHKALLWRTAQQISRMEYEATFPETARFIHFVADRIATR